LWHLFNMKNRFICTLAILIPLFRNALFILMSQVFLAGNAIPVTSYWGLTVMISMETPCLSYSFQLVP
jgi:hypothetical protein